MNINNEKRIATIDLGGTNIRLALWQNNKISSIQKHKTNKVVWEETMLKVLDFLNKNCIDEVAMAMPGPADHENGVMVNPVNLPGWWDLDIKNYILKNTNVKKIVFDNDAKLMALGNYKNLNLSKNDVMQFITISTGIGGGLIIDGKIFRGAFGRAQEIFETPSSIECEQNNKVNCYSLEYFSSGSGFEARAKKHLNLNTTIELFNEYKKGNKIAIKIIEEGIDALSRFIANVGSILNPSHIVFDGSISRNESWYVYKAFEKAKSLMYLNQWNDIKLIISDLGDDSTLIGAYYLLEAIHE